MVQTGIDSENKKNYDAVLVQGSLWRAIWIMSWPLMLTTICSSFIGLTDVYVSKVLGSGPQAAVGVSEQLLFICMVFIMSTSIATTAIVSRSIGANDMEQAVKGTAQSISFSVMMGLVLTAIALTFCGFGISLVSKEPDVIVNSNLYLSIYSLYLVPFSITAIVNAAFRAIGDTKKPLLIMGTATAINIAGDFLTVMCDWPVPGLGIRGIALSGVLGSTVGAIMALTFLKRSILKDCFNKLFPIDPAFIRRIVNIGLPSGFQRMVWATSVFILFSILRTCEHPTAALASWTIGMRVEGVVFMPLLALSMSVSSIVGQNLGAKQIDRAVTAGWNVTKIGVVLMLIMGSIMFFLADWLAAGISQDPDTIRYVADYLRVNACSEPFLALGMVLAGALQGAGDTKTPMWIGIATHWIFRMPVAMLLVLVLHMGPRGCWIAMASSIVAMGLLTVWRYQSKGWIDIKI